MGFYIGGSKAKQKVLFIVQLALPKYLKNQSGVKRGEAPLLFPPPSPSEGEGGHRGMGLELLEKTGEWG